MPRGDNLKTRLPFWNLIFLALVLSGGGFFWYATQQRQILEQLDDELFSTARHIDFFYDKIATSNSATNPLCENLTDLAASTQSGSSIAVYSQHGTLVCFSERTGTDNLPTFPGEIQPTGSLNTDPVKQSRGDQHLLTYPVIRNNQAAFYLTISAPLSEQRKQLNLLATILLLSGIITLTCFAAMQRKLKCRNLLALGHLATLMDQTSTEAPPKTFKVTEAAGSELQTLAKSYNNLMTRLSDNLRRARQFAADVTHELRTPLTILRGETELALRNGKDQAQLRQVLESNLEEISRMSYLIEDLLLLSKSDLGEIPLKKDFLHLEELINELHHQAQLLATAKNIYVELNCPQEQIILRADSLRLRQVFLNLLTNAIKYTPQEGQVTIDLSLQDETVEISIADTGIGIDPEHLELIFDRFYRVNKTHNRNDGGSGLGLAIVKWIVDAHDGSINVASTPGQGSKFTIRLPQSKPEHSLSPEKS